MRQLPTNICPLLVIAKANPSVCLEDRCAWWDGECAITSIADSLTDIAAEMEEEETHGR